MKKDIFVIPYVDNVTSSSLFNVFHCSCHHGTVLLRFGVIQGVYVSVGLGAGLAVGAVAEAAKRGLGLANISDASRSLLGKVSVFS